MSAVLWPIELVVSWVLVGLHSILAPLFGADTGWAWGLAIVGLVAVIRTLLIPLFVRQIKAQRGLQRLQPEIKKLQETYKGDQDRLSQELMKLYRETGTNPLYSCLPLFVHIVILFALFRVLYRLGGHDPEVLGAFAGREALVQSARDATIFGARISETFMSADGLVARAVALLLIVLMTVSAFLAQKQLMSKHMPAESMASPFVKQQKVMLFVFPGLFAVTGVNFPVGVLLYWLASNLWTMGEQSYVIRSTSPEA